MEVGAHTRSHPILSSIDDALAHLEITVGKAELEAILDEPVDVFAYPNGNPQRDLTSKHVEMVKMAGFRSAAAWRWFFKTPMCSSLAQRCLMK